ncbi:suppressor of tumorigenicity 14 protein homolog [Pecten maximus]|uniref:suppressor of tumorigenicity 14 protein homolog n=1 Tax=Pecten maximus TaxID=6579 RepID=UPI001458371F|nr:suppressor of tumorigenicity 14 protein homolog [Pecten maximus]
MEYKTEVRCLQFWVLAFSVGTTLAFYLIADYYMDPGVSNAFGGICNKRVEDACVYVNSHINPLYMWDYDDNVDCVMTLDAGSMASAKFKVEWHHFNVQHSTSCTADYLSIYDADMTDISNSSLLIGKFCGGVVNITGYPTQRYLTFQFHTDGSANDIGWRLRATRYEAPPCQDDEYLCPSENICIDGRLKCDGTYQCADLTDENDCTFTEEFIGAFLALGMGGLVGVGIGCIGGCVAIWVVVGAFTCCKKCCKVCCFKCCCWWPCCKGRCGNPPANSKVGPQEVDEWGDDFKKTAMEDDIAIVDEDNGNDFGNDNEANNETELGEEAMEMTKDVDGGRHTSMSGVGTVKEEGLTQVV